MNGWESIRREIAALADQKGDVDFVMCGNLAQGLSKGVVLVPVQSIELLFVVNGDNGQPAAVLDFDGGVRHCANARMEPSPFEKDFSWIGMTKWLHPKSGQNSEPCPIS